MLNVTILDGSSISGLCVSTVTFVESCGSDRYYTIPSGKTTFSSFLTPAYSNGITELLYVRLSFAVSDCAYIICFCRVNKCTWWCRKSTTSALFFCHGREFFRIYKASNGVALVDSCCDVLQESSVVSTYSRKKKRETDK